MTRRWWLRMTVRCNSSLLLVRFVAQLHCTASKDENRRQRHFESTRRIVSNGVCDGAQTSKRFGDAATILGWCPDQWDFCYEVRGIHDPDSRVGTLTGTSITDLVVSAQLSDLPRRVWRRWERPRAYDRRITFYANRIATAMRG